MADFEEQSLNGRNARAGRIRWSEQMNSDLLECKRQALILTKSENPPVKDNGRRKGYMELVKELWDQMGHKDMKFTKQNLRDQAAQLKKSLRSVNSTITNGLKAKRGGDNAWLAQLGERRSAEREVTDSNPGRTNTQGL